MHNHTFTFEDKKTPKGIKFIGVATRDGEEVYRTKPQRSHIRALGALQEMIKKANEDRIEEGE